MSLQNNKKMWVYESIIQNDKDHSGFIAYAFYKKEKHELAVQLREEGKEESEIQSQLNTFHDQSLTEVRLQSYREKSDRFIDSIIKVVDNKARESYQAKLTKAENRISQMKKEKKDAVAKAKMDGGIALATKVLESPDIPKSRTKMFFSWCLSGMASIVMTVVVAGTLYAFAAFNTDDATKDKLKLEIATKLVSGLTTVPDVIPEGKNSKGKNSDGVSGG
tara:strand:+ start:1707 stop:2366 length:660 start_codon:yes stop_codon:yes gene_type:complete